MADKRPEEELYDILEDSHELHNLVDSRQHADVLSIMRNRMDGWIKDTNDQGALAENPEIIGEIDLGIKGLIFGSLTPVFTIERVFGSKIKICFTCRFDPCRRLRHIGRKIAGVAKIISYNMNPPLTATGNCRHDGCDGYVHRYSSDTYLS